MNMINNFKGLVLPLLAGFSLVGVTSCGDSLLDDLNQNTETNTSGGLTRATSLDQASGYLLTAQQKVHDIEEHQYQYQSNLHIDNYCGYLCLPQNFDGRQPSTYYFNKDFASGPRGSFFNVSKNTLPVMRSADSLKIPEIGAMATILYCYAAQELADVYGPFPWWDYKQEKQDPPLNYYSVKDIYDSITCDLRKSVAILKNYNSTSNGHQDTITELMKKDRICGGDVQQWIKFANSLHLRMALHLSTVLPDTAKKWAKEAINSGVLAYDDKDIAYDVITQDGNKNGNPLAFISNSWKDTRLNASFENILKRLKSPLLSVWFSKNYDNIKDLSGNLVVKKDSMIVGMRSGIATTPRNNDNMYVNFSNISTAYSFHPVYLMKASEVQFLKAEAALRWNSEGEMISPDDAYTAYTLGIVSSLKDEGITNEGTQNAYLAVEKADTSINYVDPYDPSNNAKGLITIGVAWNEDDSREVKLEKIITQKYIANFPLGLEAWTDLRRTGFPRIFSVVDDDGDGSVPEGDIIRRIPYIIGDDSDKQDVLQSAVPKLGGSDLQGTRLWWDTGKLF